MHTSDNTGMSKMSANEIYEYFHVIIDKEDDFIRLQRAFVSFRAKEIRSTYLGKEADGFTDCGLHTDFESWMPKCKELLRRQPVFECDGIVITHAIQQDDCFLFRFPGDQAWRRKCKISVCFHETVANTNRCSCHLEKTEMKAVVIERILELSGAPSWRLITPKHIQHLEENLKQRSDEKNNEPFKITVREDGTMCVYLQSTKYVICDNYGKVSGLYTG